MMGLENTHSQTDFSAKHVYIDLYQRKKHYKDTPNKESAVTSWTIKIGAMIIGFILPMLGMGLYFLLKDDRPKDAKYIGIPTVLSLSFFTIFTLFIIFYNILPLDWGAQVFDSLPDWSDDWRLP